MSFVLAQSKANKSRDHKTQISAAKSYSSRGIGEFTKGYHRDIIYLQRTNGDQASQNLIHSNATFDFAKIRIQPKLKVSGPGDTSEREADKVAEQVMCMPEPQIQRKCACGGSCPRCQSEESQEHEHLLMRRAGSSDLGQNSALPIVSEVLGSPGQPLDPATRSFMEPRFGFDFSQVRVHTDVKAEESARAVDALAYTVGHDVVFRAGQYAPEKPTGRALLAHELTHVVQQRTQQFDQLQRSCVPSACPTDYESLGGSGFNWESAEICMQQQYTHIEEESWDRTRTGVS